MTPQRNNKHNEREEKHMKTAVPGLWVTDTADASVVGQRLQASVLCQSPQASQRLWGRPPEHVVDVPPRI
eukprot:8526761-Pyramimonas_sp.AAC.1